MSEDDAFDMLRQIRATFLLSFKGTAENGVENVGTIAALFVPFSCYTPMSGFLRKLAGSVYAARTTQTRMRKYQKYRFVEKAKSERKLRMWLFLEKTKETLEIILSISIISIRGSDRINDCRGRKNVVRRRKKCRKNDNRAEPMLKQQKMYVASYNHVGLVYLR
jgi:hypothetical protein